MDTLCRICGNTLCDSSVNLLPLADQVSRYLNFSVITDDRLSKKCCQACYQKLTKVDIFVKMAANTQLKLLQLLNKLDSEKNEPSVSNLEVKKEMDFEATSTFVLNWNKEVLEPKKEPFKDLDIITIDLQKSVKKINMKNRCPICLNPFSSKKGPEDHVCPDKADWYKVICTICDKLFRDNAKLKFHIDRFHQNPKQFPCRFCPQKCVTKTDLKVHEKKHAGEKPHKCSKCEEAFETMDICRRHESESHGILAFKCAFCGEAFARAYDVRKHRQIHKSDTKSEYLCDLCGKSFKELSVLRTHKKLIHENVSKQCSICGKRVKHIWEHMKFVHEKRPHHRDTLLCDFCGTEFTRKFCLRRHVASHVKSA